MNTTRDFYEDGWLQFTRIVLFCNGLFYLPLIVFSPFHFYDMAVHASIPERRAIFCVVLLISLVFCGGLSLASFSAAWGIVRRKRWAWIIAVISGGLYVPSCLFPIGAVMLYGLLRDHVRRAFME
ncbi:MAG: hypothetical protein U0165_04850 [Polyangiaceae bacterium]